MSAGLAIAGLLVVVLGVSFLGEKPGKGVGPLPPTRPIRVAVKPAPAPVPKPMPRLELRLSRL